MREFSGVWSTYSYVLTCIYLHMDPERCCSTIGDYHHTILSDLESRAWGDVGSKFVEVGWSCLRVFWSNAMIIVGMAVQASTNMKLQVTKGSGKDKEYCSIDCFPYNVRVFLCKMLSIRYDVASIMTAARYQIYIANAHLNVHCVMTPKWLIPQRTIIESFQHRY